MLLLAAVAGQGDTLQTKTGETFKGRIIEETSEHLRVRTQFGDLTVPKAQIRSHERTRYVVKLKNGSTVEGHIVGETAKRLSIRTGKRTTTLDPDSIASTSAKKPVVKPTKPQKLTPQELRRHHAKGMEYFQKKQYAKALAEFQALVKDNPENGVALYNCACAYALMKDKPNALLMLTKAIESGWVNFRHLEQDSDLDILREEPGYKAILAKKSEYIQAATEKTVGRITEGLKKRGVKVEEYRIVFDRDRNFVYVHNRSDEDLAVLRKGLEEYAEYQWTHLLQNRPQRPLYIVLLSAGDSRKVLRRRVGGVYQAAFNTLLCGDMPTYRLLKTSVVVHEFTHALHFADMLTRQQMHPIWLIEGLATLFESSDRNGEVVPRHSHRLGIVQTAIRSNRSIPWRKLMSMKQPEFLRVAGLAYAQSRYMLFYIHEKGLLKRFYDEYTKGDNYGRDKSALASFEVVFGKPIESVEREWKTWVLAQKVPPVPFLGVSATAKDNRLTVRKVSGKSPAGKAGVRAGDVIASIDGRAVQTMNDMMAAIGARNAGDEVTVVVIRKEKELTFTAKLGSRKPPQPRLPPGPRRPSYLGIAVEEHEGKLIVKEVSKGSPAAKAKVAVGAEIVAFNGKALKTVRDYLAKLREARPGQTVRLRCKTGDKTANIRIRLVTQPGS
jgi:translation initiation factor IF-1